MNETLRHQLQGRHSPLNVNSDAIKGSTAYAPHRHSYHGIDAIMHHGNRDVGWTHNHNMDAKDSKTEEFLLYLDTFQQEAKGML